MLFRVSLGSGRRSLPWMVVVVVVFVVVARMDEGERSRERIVASIGRMTNIVKMRVWIVIGDDYLLAIDAVR